MNALQRLLVTAVTLAAGVAPEAWRPYIFGLVHVLNSLSFQPGDGRMEELMTVVSEFLDDVTKALSETDATALEALRRTAEVKATRKLASLGYLQGVGPR